MKKELIGILISMLLVGIVLPVSGIRIENEIIIPVKNITIDDEFKTPFFGLLNSIDQKQLSGYTGAYIHRQWYLAQEFKPSKSSLTAVALKIKAGSSPDDKRIIVSIRDDLNSPDLRRISYRTDQINSIGNWMLFNFHDIDVIPEKTYYIVCNSDLMDSIDGYVWCTSTYDILGAYDLYDRGAAWTNHGSIWIKMTYLDTDQEIDFCFITFWKNTLNRTSSRPVFLGFLDMFPILHRLLNFN